MRLFVLCFSLCFVFVYSCKDKKDQKVQDRALIKAQHITDFKNEIFKIADSADVLYESGLKWVADSLNTSEITEKIKPLSDHYQQEIDTKIKLFQTRKAIILNLSDEEIAKIFEDLNTQMKPTIAKYQALIDKGIALQ